MHHSDSFTAAFDFASGATGERFQNPLWQVTEIPFGRRFRQSVATVKAFGSELVSKAVMAKQSPSELEEAVVRPSSSGSLDKFSGSLINSLLDSIDDPQIVADAALNYLTAGMYKHHLPYFGGSLTYRKGYHCSSTHMGILLDDAASECRQTCACRSSQTCCER